MQHPGTTCSSRLHKGQQHCRAAQNPAGEPRTGQYQLGPTSCLCRLCSGNCWQVAPLAPHTLPREQPQPIPTTQPAPQGSNHTHHQCITALLCCALTTTQLLCTSNLHVFPLWSPKRARGHAAHPTSLYPALGQWLLAAKVPTRHHLGRTAGLWVRCCQQSSRLVPCPAAPAQTGQGGREARDFGAEQSPRTSQRLPVCRVTIQPAALTI